MGADDEHHDVDLPSYEDALRAGASPPVQRSPQQPPQQHQAPTTAPQSPPYAYFGSVPVRLTCQYCGHEGLTRTNKEPGAGTWLWVLLFCLLLWIVFFWLVVLFLLVCCICIVLGGLIPLCIDDMKDTVHYCEECGREVGRQRLMG